MVTVSFQLLRLKTLAWPQLYFFIACLTSIRKPHWLLIQTIQNLTVPHLHRSRFSCRSLQYSPNVSPYLYLLPWLLTTAQPPESLWNCEIVFCLCLRPGFPNHSEHSERSSQWPTRSHHLTFLTLSLNSLPVHSTLATLASLLLEQYTGIVLPSALIADCLFPLETWRLFPSLPSSSGPVSPRLLFPTPLI